MLFTVFAVLRLKNLFAAVILLSIYSLLAASLFVAMDAVDVAFTEAAVGAGISSILMLATLLYVGQESSPAKKTKWAAVLICVALGALLIYGTYDLPEFGHDGIKASQFAAKIHSHVITKEFFDRAPEKTGIINVVTAVLASIRGYDTLGEVTVVFCAGIGVIILLSGMHHSGTRKTKTGDSESQS
jgi:multicomponent Na+:H+ antiporter subunit B